MLAPRRLFALCSPSTQVMASTTLLLPHPFGPTMAVTPWSNDNSERSGKLLNPEIWRRDSFIWRTNKQPRWPWAQFDAPRPEAAGKSLLRLRIKANQPARRANRASLTGPFPRGKNEVPPQNIGLAPSAGALRAAQLRELQGFVEQRLREGGLRILSDEVAARFFDPEQVHVDLVPNHRADEGLILLEGLIVHADALGDDVVPEVGQHLVGHREAAPDVLPLAAAARARVACGFELFGEADEQAAAHEHATEACRIEALDWAGEESIGLDAATAVDLASRVRIFEFRRVMFTGALLGPQGIGEVLVERAIPGPLNQAATRCLVLSGCEREARLVADAIERLHERFAEGRLANDEATIVILHRARHDLGCAGAVPVDQHD